MELKDTKTGLFSKPYIRQAWMMCGFIDDVQHVTLQGREVDVWRVEFSICSPKRGWAPLDVNGNPNKKYSLRNTLEMYEGRDKLLTIFASLSKNYFRFKKYKEGQRKDRCEDKKLFDFLGHTTNLQTFKGYGGMWRAGGQNETEVQPSYYLAFWVRLYPIWW